MLTPQGVLFCFDKLDKDTPVATTPGIKPFDNSSVYIAFEEYSVFMIHGTDAYVKKDSKPVSFHAYMFYEHARAVPDELHPYRLYQEKIKLPTFALFLDAEIQQTKMISFSLMPPFISTIKPIDYHTTGRSKMWETKAEM